MWANLIATTKSRLQITNEKDGDHPEDSYVSRVLRQYYIAKQGFLPEWLEDPRQPRRAQGPQQAAAPTRSAMGFARTNSPSAHTGTGVGGRPKANLRDILHRQDSDSSASANSLSNISLPATAAGRPPQGATSADRLRNKLRSNRMESESPPTSPVGRDRVYRPQNRDPRQWRE